MNSVEQRKIIAKFAVVIVAVLLILLCYSYLSFYLRIGYWSGRYSEMQEKYVGV